MLQTYYLKLNVNCRGLRRKKITMGSFKQLYTKMSRMYSHERYFEGPKNINNCMNDYIQIKKHIEHILKTGKT